MLNTSDWPMASSGMAQGIRRPRRVSAAVASTCVRTAVIVQNRTKTRGLARRVNNVYLDAAFTGRGAAVEHGVALKLASLGSLRNDVLV